MVWDVIDKKEKRSGRRESRDFPILSRANLFHSPSFIEEEWLIPRYFISPRIRRAFEPYSRLFLNEFNSEIGTLIFLQQKNVFISCKICPEMRKSFIKLAQGVRSLRGSVCICHIENIRINIPRCFIFSSFFSLPCRWTRSCLSRLTQSEVTIVLV